ncbi:MAG: hypothetical protein AAFN50_10725 [Pseudomonadota bacterium]
MSNHRYSPEKCLSGQGNSNLHGLRLVPIKGILAIRHNLAEDLEELYGLRF